MPRPRSPFETETVADRAGGSAMVMALLVLFVLMAMGASTISLAISRQSVAKTTKEVDRAYVVADAGINRAMFELRLGTDLGGDGIGNAAGSIGGGSYTVTTTPVFSGPGEYTVRAIGTVAGIRRGIETVLRDTPRSLGFFGIDNVRMSGGIVDSYDSSLGSYASQVGGLGYAGSSASLGSNADIDLSGSATIYGDAVPGPTGSVTGSTTNVSGSTAPAAAPQTVDPYSYSPSVASSGSQSGTATLGAGVHRFDDVTVSGGQILTLDGDMELYVDGAFTISGSGQCIVTSGSHVTIHHGTGNFTISGSGVLNVAQAPDNLHLFSATAGRVEISGSGAFHGAVHAPNAQGVVSGSGGVFGSFVGRTLNLSGGSTLHQDLALGSAAGGFRVVMMRPFQP